VTTLNENRGRRHRKDTEDATSRFVIKTLELTAHYCLNGSKELSK